MSRKNKRRILWILILSFFVMPWMVARAEGSFELVVKDLKGHDGKLEYDLWKVSKKTYLTEEQLEYRHKKCQSMGKEELEEKYGKAIEGRRDRDKGWVFDVEETGLYYGRQKDGESKAVDFMAIVKDQKSVSIRPKTSTNRVVLKKYLNEISNENLLPGMKFELYDANGNLQYFRNGRWVNPGTMTATTVHETDGQGSIILIDLPPGNYEFHEIEQEGYELESTKEELSFSITSGSNAVINIVVINKGDDPRGGHGFHKVNEQGEDLEGAIFKLYRRDQEGTLKPVLQEGGREYIIRSAEDGSFHVDNLLYGDYVLVETKAPVKGDKVYEPLKEEISFTIDEGSENNAPILIVNKESPEESEKPDKPSRPDEPASPDKPSKPSKPSIKVPKTGDIQIFLFTIGGLMLTILGGMVYGMPKKEKVKK